MSPPYPKIPPFPSRAAASLALAAPLLARAADAPAPGVSAGAMLQTIAGLALILVLFLGAAWLARRFGAGGGLRSGNGPLRVIDAVALSPRERIVLVEVADNWLVVGVGPGQIRTLHTLAKGSLPPEAAANGKFGQWLQHFGSGEKNAGS